MTTGLHWLDANVLIQAKNQAYPFDLVAGFWAWLEKCSADGKVRSPMMVHNELVKGNDELSKWAKKMRTRGFFIEPDHAVQGIFGTVVDYVKATYKLSYCTSFLDGADPWMIAHARANNGTVVTFEKQLSPDAKRPKIPNLCSHFTIPCINLWDLTRIFKLKL